MKYDTVGSLVTTSILFENQKGKITGHALVGENPTQLATLMQGHFAKLKIGCSITWNIGNENQIRMSRHTGDYDNTSKYKTTYTRTELDQAIIISDKKTTKNITYECNPECQMCFKKVIKLYSIIMVNGEESNICNNCKKDVNHAKEFLARKNK